MEKLFLLVLSLLQRVYAIECAIHRCNEALIGSDICRPECNNILCNFDSIVQIEGLSNSEIFQSSKCIVDCIAAGCTLELLENDSCDPECNNKYCAFDLGLCGVCAENCWVDELLDKKCHENSPCNTDNCGFDNYECTYCVKGCGISDVLKEVCENDLCRDELCRGYLINNCFKECSPFCLDEYLGNGYCDYDCNNAKCNYDNGECLCAPDCNIDELETDCKGILDPCNTKSCNYKYTKCSGCKSDCKDEMINNNICNPECYNNKENPYSDYYCRLDEFDCECFYKCPMYRKNNDFIILPNYKESNTCYNPSCWYNIKNNPDDFVKRYKIMSIMIFSIFYYFNPNNLPSGCNIQTLRQYDSLNGPKCDITSPCYSKKAMWCLGRASNNTSNCLRATNNKCIICNGVMVENECKSEFSDCPPDSELISNLTELFNENSTKLKWCVNTTVGRYEHVPQIIYVNSSDPPLLTGNGTKENPYLSLFYAFTKINKDYTRIILSSGNHYFVNDSSVTYNQQEIRLSFIILTIQGDPESPSVVYWIKDKSQNILKIVWTGKKLVIKNIIFDGRKILSDGCSLPSEYCFYCPFFYNSKNNTNTNYISDKFEYFSDQSTSDLYYQPTKCSMYNEIILFTLNKSAFLQNVTFRYFTIQNKALIKSINILVLENVTFERIQPSSKGSVIEISCENICENVFFSFHKGSIRDLNIGYSIKEWTETGGFLRATHIRLVKIIEVDFNFSVLYSGKNSGASSFLFSFISIFDNIKIDQCKFSNIYAKTFMIFDMTLVNYEEFFSNVTFRSEVINTVHLQISNSLFENIFTTGHLINHLTKTFTQNTFLNNLTFSHVFSADSSIINIDFQGALDYKNTKVGIFKLDFQTVTLEQRKIILNQLKFFWVSAGEFVINVHKQPNVFLNDVLIDGNHDGTRNDLFEIIQNFYKNGKYMKLMPRSDLIGNLNCSGSIKINECINVTLKNNSLENCFCGGNQASSGIIFESIHKDLKIIDTKFNNMKSNGDQGTIFMFYSNEANIYIENVDGNMISNFIGPLIEFNECPSILIKSIKLKNLEVYFSSPIKVINSIKFEMNDIDLIEVHNYKSNCGFILFMLSIKDISTIRVSNLVIQNVWVYGIAGIFMFDSVIAVKSHNIYIKNVTFKKISSKKGTFLYISEKVSINDSLISGVFGSENFDSNSMIYDTHVDGLLLLENIEFFNNTRILTQGIKAQYQEYGKLLEVKNFTVRDCLKSDNIIEIVGNSIILTQVLFENVTITSVGSSIDKSFAEALKLTSVSAIFKELNVKKMKDLADISNTELTIYNASFTELSTSLINSQNNGYFQCYNCKIFKNFGTLFSISGESYLILENSEIFNNIYKGIKTSLFQIDSNGNNSIKETKIKDNFSQSSNMIELYNTNLQVTSCLISNNTSDIPASSVLTSYSSLLQIRNSTFFNYFEKTSGSFLNMALSSSLIVSDSNFVAGISTSSGGAISVDNCLHVTISDSSFKNNTSFNKGGAIFSKNTKLSIYNSFFVGNKAIQGSDLYLSDHSYSLENSKFLESQALGTDQQFSILASGAYLNLSSIVFANLSYPVSALKTSDMKEILIISSLFTNINGLFFGASYFEGGTSEGNLFIVNTTFQDNLSNHTGGGVTVKDMNVEISRSTFISNRALISGGGFFFESPNCKNCEFVIKEKSNLFNNSALISGGGIMWQDFKPIIEKSVNFSDNYALYGPDYATRPARLASGDLKTMKLNVTQAEAVRIFVTPGQPLTEALVLSVYDSYGQVISSDFSSIIELKSSGQIIISGQSSFVAHSGTFNLSDFTLRAKPGTNGVLIATIDSVLNEKVRNDEIDYQNNITIQVSLKECGPGEASDLDTCTVCPVNEFLIKSGKTCKSCPAGGICPGGSNIWVKPNYFRTTNESEVIYQCQLKDVCLGNKTGYKSECLEGYSGITCYTCENQYTKGSSGSCSKCPDKKLNYFISVLLVVSFVSMCTILVITTINSAFTAKSKYSIYIKIFTNYLQLIYLTTEFNLSWPFYLQEFFKVQRSLATISDVFFSIDCFSELKTSEDYEKVYYLKLFLYSLFPIIIFIGSTFVWWFICSTKDNYSQMKRELPLTIIVIFFLVHPGLVKFIYSSFSCTYFDQLGSFLTQNHEVKCWTRTHQKYSLCLSLPSILLWSIGTPTLILIMMIKQRKRLFKDQNRIVFGFMCNGYKSSVFYWEFIVLYRKLVMICILVFTSQTSVYIQALLVELALIFAFFLQYKIKPYNSSELNSLELESLLAANVTIYCGQFFLVEGMGNFASFLLFFTVVLGNCFFIVKWIYWMSFAISDTLVKHFHQLRHLLKKGDAFAEDFNNEIIHKKGLYYDKVGFVKSCTFIEYKEENVSEFSFDSLNQLYSNVFLSEIEKSAKDSRNTEDDDEKRNLIEVGVNQN